ncbi:hypothetical protein PHLCEN_2v4349 [Hermanssonia centrifuga]|uniref:Fungal-type protein kinase domain-containing protein n=1 Tax=Hermanssonia centrifuga TaxID=98765 RepID=A0A2R6PWA7_9APHY|nr:hypothetical protein PHLCEN_2v4349 [Hermanssonia centrifuga]
MESICDNKAIPPPKRPLNLRLSVRSIMCKRRAEGEHEDEGEERPKVPLRSSTGAHHSSLIHFFSSITFAQRHQLGWDPTMKVLADSKQSTKYEITVRSENGEENTFRTWHSLSDSSTEQLLGRGTRVWKAIRTQDGKDCGEPVALKDAWVDHDREREGDVFTRLRQSGISAAHTVVLDKCFLTVQCHGDVFISGNRDCTVAWLPSISQATPAANGAPVAGPSSAISADVPHRQQAHYRVVFEEVGKPLANETSLCTVFKILAGAAIETTQDLEKVDIAAVEGVYGTIRDNFREACAILQSKDIQVVHFEDIQRGSLLDLS